MVIFLKPMVSLGQILGMYGKANDEYAKELKNFTTIDCPVLFIQATYDSVLTKNLNTHNKMVCTNLTEDEIACGHWMQREKPQEVNLAIEKWIKENF